MLYFVSMIKKPEWTGWFNLKTGEPDIGWSI